jgi:hypothetical protein
MATTTTTPRIIRLRSLRDETGTVLTGIVKDLHTGGRDLYGDFETLVRDVRRDTVKLGKALRGDVQRLAKAPAARTAPLPEPHRPARPPRRRTAPAHPRKQATA